MQQNPESIAKPDVLPSPDEHYKIVIEDARALGDRRDAINSMFVNIVSLIAGGAGYVLINKPGSAAGLVVVLAACIFGWRLCHVWEDVLGNYKWLLNFRYQTLKEWESRYDFPSLRRYYTSEDLLYGPLKTPTELSESMPAKWVGKAGVFISMYVVLPKSARIVFLVLALLQTIAFAWRVGSPFLVKLPLPWHMLPPLNF